MPDDYKDVFAVLQKPLGLAPELVGGLSATAGMRNVLVHVYLGWTTTGMGASLGHLGDLREFAAAVKRLD